MATETTTQESVAQEAAPAKPSAKKARSKKQVAQKPVAKKSTAKKNVKKRAVKKAAPKKSATKKKVAKKRASKKLVVAKKSVAKKVVAKKGAPKKRKVKKQLASNGTTKAQSIRDMANELGKKARPRDIIAALAAEGISVSSPQVTTTLKAAGLRRGRRRKKMQASITSKPSANGNLFVVDELVKVKKLADELGGTTKIKELASALERLL